MLRGTKMKLKLSLRIWILIVAIVLALLAIKPSFSSGVVIKSIDSDSPLVKEGVTSGQVIKAINGKPIKTLDDYAKALEEINSQPGEKRVEIVTDKAQAVVLTNQSLGLSVGPLPRTNIQTGLDLQGGARALVKPDVEHISEEEMQKLVDISRNRFNVYGLSDVSIKAVTDLEGNRFMLIEVAGATPDNLRDLISQQGKFEAKVGNVTVFEGGKQDIADVCRNDASCATIESCLPSGQGFVCRYRFAVYLTEAAAKKHAAATANLSLDSSGRYLNESLHLFIDDKEVDSLLIGASLRGRATTQISIQGSGAGPTREAAIKAARASMNRLQTILLTGSLPYKLEIVKLDTISPSLGTDFTYAVFIAAIAAIFSVSLIVFARYRKIKASLALLLTSFSELIIILGVAALIRWNLDLPSIAGILATIGTGVDQQVIILDEAGGRRELSIKEKIKRATWIILSAYLTLVAAMVPLYWAGAGLFKGFAITTIIGVTAGVLITRPAFADIIKRIES
ncbi:PDZ domain-containing protein [Candidatus Pacearchaeota archaeon]|nr:MAG: PDZ domain-containing protein [Candidatus Pacearchaeota archaeon]